MRQNWYRRAQHLRHVYRNGAQCPWPCRVWLGQLCLPLQQHRGLLRKIDEQQCELGVFQQIANSVEQVVAWVIGENDAPSAFYPQQWLGAAFRLPPPVRGIAIPHAACRSQQKERLRFEPGLREIREDTVITTLYCAWHTTIIPNRHGLAARQRGRAAPRTEAVVPLPAWHCYGGKGTRRLAPQGKS